ncbi:hypothetical protein [Actinocrispum sp. NPDC049592]|uniref:hypothetical protein n=1 Tax=Actinocrispum sp. NPDC049592 TaxID=3154835 RepID=UPI0034440AF4
MLKRFLVWMEDYVAVVGVVGLIGSFIGLLAFAAVPGSVVGSTAIKASVVTTAILAVISLYAALVTSIRAARGRRSSDEQVLHHYSRIMRAIQRGTLHISDWNQVAVIADNGDTTETLTLDATVACDELYVFRWRIGAAWPQPWRERSRMTFDVHSAHISDMGEARMHVTSAWLPDGRLELNAHFKPALKRGTPIRIAMEWNWPGKCVPLMRDNRPDSFCICFVDTIEHVRYTIVLPEGKDVYYDPIGFDAQDRSYSLTSATNQHGNTEIVFAGRDIPAEHKVGMRLNLK